MLDQALLIAKAAALEAGQRILEIYHTDFKIDYKEDESPLTCADREADKIIIEHISKVFPEHAILSEESSDDLIRLHNTYCWTVI